MAVFSDPFGALANFQQALDAFRASSWLDAGPSGGGAYPPVNVFRKGDDFIVIAEIPGVKKSDLDVQVKGRTLRLSGVESVAYAEKAAVHRRRAARGPLRPRRDPAGRDQSGRRQGRVSRRDPGCSCPAPRAKSRNRSRWPDMTRQPNPKGATMARYQGNGGPREEGARPPRLKRRSRVDTHSGRRRL